MSSTNSTIIYIVAGILVFFGGMFFLFYKLFFQHMIMAKRINKIGIPARARILEVRDTGVTINQNPQVKLVLEVRNNLGQKYTTTCRTLVSRLNTGMYQPGMEVAVKVHPTNEKLVVIDTSNKQASQASYNNTVDTTALKSELEQLQQSNDAIRLSGRQAKAIIKKYTWLGVNVNGNNPYVELEIVVMPETSPAFNGKTKGVISETSVEKYQPGKEIYIKYDLYDNSKIVIDHS